MTNYRRKLIKNESNKKRSFCVELFLQLTCLNNLNCKKKTSNNVKISYATARLSVDFRSVLNQNCVSREQSRILHKQNHYVTKLGFQNRQLCENIRDVETQEAVYSLPFFLSNRIQTCFSQQFIMVHSLGFNMFLKFTIICVYHIVGYYRTCSPMGSVLEPPLTCIWLLVESITALTCKGC